MNSEDHSIGSSSNQSAVSISSARLAARDGESRDVKVVTVGESGVGKTSLTLRFANNQFKENVVATIGASFLTKTVHRKDLNKNIRFNIWDTAGQEKYRSLASLYYRGVDCAVIVYDITDRTSFEEVENYWMQELKHQCFGDGGLVLCLAGNKSDLVDKRQVSWQEGMALAEEFGALFFETSAKSDSNVSEIFNALANDLPEHERTVSSASNNIYKVHIPERKMICCA